MRLVQAQLAPGPEDEDANRRRPSEEAATEPRSGAVAEAPAEARKLNPTKRRKPGRGHAHRAAQRAGSRRARLRGGDARAAEAAAAEEPAEVAEEAEGRRKPPSSIDRVGCRRRRGLGAAPQPEAQVDDFTPYAAPDEEAPRRRSPLLAILLIVAWSSLPPPPSGSLLRTN